MYYFTKEFKKKKCFLLFNNRCSINTYTTYLRRKKNYFKYLNKDFLQEFWI